MKGSAENSDKKLGFKKAILHLNKVMKTNSFQMYLSSCAIGRMGVLGVLLKVLRPCVPLPWPSSRGRVAVWPSSAETLQGDHSTGKTGNLDVTFSRQGNHREFRPNIGKIVATQGKF